MIERLMQCLIAAFVALAFGMMPTLVLAGDASPPPPRLCAIAPDVGLATMTTEYTSDEFSAHTGKTDLVDLRSNETGQEPSFPLRE